MEQSSLYAFELPCQRPQPRQLGQLGQNGFRHAQLLTGSCGSSATRTKALFMLCFSFIIAAGRSPVEPGSCCA